MKMKDPIDLHKGLTAPLVLGLMALYDNWTVGPWIYLACHGSYGVMWVLKSRALFPDPAWEVEVPWYKGIGIWLALLLYWLAPFLLISGGQVPPDWVLCLGVTSCILGTFLHFGADAQKYYTLQVRRGLITSGFFARTRNPNYLGEVLLYGGFATLSLHWIPWVVLALYVGVVFVPNMLRKDRSMSRYPEWAAYKARTGLILPKLWGPAGETGQQAG